VLIENQLAKPGDGHLKRFGDDIVAKGNHVYHVITRPSTSIEEMKMRVFGAYADSLFGVILGNERGLRMAMDSVWEQKADAIDWAACIREIWFDAYDGEGFVIWGPPSR